MHIERKSHSTSTPPVPPAQPAARRSVVGGRTVLLLPGQRPLSRPVTGQAPDSPRREGKPVADRELKHGLRPSSAAGKRKREEEEQAFVAALPPASSSSSSSSPSLDSTATRRAQAEAFIDAHAGVLDCENARSNCEKLFAAALKEKRCPADIAEISRALRDRFGGAVLDAQTARAWAEAVTRLGVGMDDPDDYTPHMAAMLHGLTHDGPVGTERTHIRHLRALGEGARSAAVATRCVEAEEANDDRLGRSIKASVPALATALGGPQIATEHLRALLHEWCRPQAYPQHLVDALMVGEPYVTEDEAVKRSGLTAAAHADIITATRHGGALAQDHWMAMVEHALAAQSGLEPWTRAYLVKALAQGGRAPVLLQHLLAATHLPLGEVAEAC